MKETVDLLKKESEVRLSGYSLVAGIDEAGRGPLAGDVYAAAVILPEGLVIEGLNDSKKLSEKRREALFDVITEKAVAYAVKTASVEEIESLNILNATHLAMRRAIEALVPSADFALIDGNLMRGLSLPHECVIKGDATCACIAAASILAKVSRDRYMNELDARYPGYDFSKHKGYGTKAHIEKIRALGPSRVHRMSFLTKIL